MAFPSFLSPMALNAAAAAADHPSLQGRRAGLGREDAVRPGLRRPARPLRALHRHHQREPRDDGGAPGKRDSGKSLIRQRERERGK